MGNYKFNGDLDVTGDILKNGAVREVGTKLYLHKCTLFINNGTDSINMFLNVTTTSAEHITSSMYSSYAVIDWKADTITAVDGTTSTQILRAVGPDGMPIYIYGVYYGTNLFGFKTDRIHKYDGSAAYPSFGEITSTYINDNITEL